jgi:O-antigen ligase
VGTAARRPSPRQLGLVIAAGGVLLLSAADGGFFPPSWRWGAAGFAAAGCAAVLFQNRLVVSRAGCAFLAGLIAFGCWTTLSAAWSLDASATLLEAQRLLLYAAALAAFLAAGRRGLTTGVVLGVTAVAVWALADRYLGGAPADPFQGKLLSAPLGYANALGAQTAMAAVACAVAAVRFRIAAVPLIGLVPALALTNSRGALLAGVVGLAGGVALAFGHRLIATAILGASFAALVIVCAVPIGGLGDRSAYWSVARAAVSGHPVAGTGAGTFAQVYRGERPQGPVTRNAHSLYLETLDELGAVGLVLLLATLAIPVVAGVRLGAAAAPAVGGYTTFLLHLGIDWDWSMPAVVVAGLALGAAAAAAGRSALDKLVSSH